MKMVIIKIDTGFVNAVHEVDTGLNVSEWELLSENTKERLISDAVDSHINAYAVDEDR